LWHPLSIVLRVLATMYVGLCAALFFFQRSLIYFPQPGSANDGGTTLTLPVRGARVLVSTRPMEGRRALIYFGGNAEDVSLSLPSFSAAMPDRAIYLMHYRGYGGSTGSPSEKTLFNDALVLFDEVYRNHPDIEIVGRSLGSGVAVYLASQRSASRLVLVTPFDSLKDIAARQFPYVPARWLLRDKFESWKYAPRVTAPTLIIAADHDEMIPAANTELLKSRFQAGLVSFAALAGTSHNTISNSPEYLPLLKGQ
jgi:uncharacterized protein